MILKEKTEKKHGKTVSKGLCVTEKTEVKDPNRYPYSTLQCIEERMGEITTLSNINRELHIKAHGIDKRTKSLYDKWKKKWERSHKIKVYIEER